MRENQPGLSHERPGHRGSARLGHDSMGKSGRSGHLIVHEHKNWIDIVLCLFIIFVEASTLKLICRKIIHIQWSIPCHWGRHLGGREGAQT